MKTLKQGGKVLLFNSRVKLFSDHTKLKSKWNGPQTVIDTSTHGAFALEDDEGSMFKDNGQRLKVFLEPDKNLDEDIDVINLVHYCAFP